MTPADASVALSEFMFIIISRLLNIKIFYFGKHFNRPLDFQSKILGYYIIQWCPTQSLGLRFSQGFFHQWEHVKNKVHTTLSTGSLLFKLYNLFVLFVFNYFVWILFIIILFPPLLLFFFSWSEHRLLFFVCCTLNLNTTCTKTCTWNIYKERDCIKNIYNVMFLKTTLKKRSKYIIFYTCSFHKRPKCSWWTRWV